MEIPKALRPQFKNQPRFIKSLETDSRTVAERRASSIITAWRRRIADARGVAPEDDAAFWRRRLRSAPTQDQRDRILEQIEEAAWEIGAVNVDHVGQAPSGDPEARRFYAEATGTIVGFTEYLDEWLSSSQATDKTKDMQRSDVKRFAIEFKTTRDVTRPEVRRWVTRLINDEGLSAKTAQRVLSALRGYWRYLQTVGIANDDDEPFHKLDISRHAKRASPQTVRKPFATKEVLKLLGQAEKDGDAMLADLIRLAMWTGCRIEELCALKKSDVKRDHISIGDAKTEAGWRDVPIHAKLKPIVKRLIEKSADGYVLSGLTANKYGDRSNGIGKRFGRMKTEMGFGRQLVFHSIRKTVVTILENAGIAENIVADIVGHEKTTMTYGLYSGGVSLAVKRKAMAKLSY
jgi:integrase